MLLHHQISTESHHIPSTAQTSTKDKLWSGSSSKFNHVPFTTPDPFMKFHCNPLITFMINVANRHTNKCYWKHNLLVRDKCQLFMLHKHPKNWRIPKDHFIGIISNIYILMGQKQTYIYMKTATATKNPKTTTTPPPPPPKKNQQQQQQNMLDIRVETFHCFVM